MSNDSSTSQPPSRQLALDVFRGLTIALMIVVNSPGDFAHIYAPLRHAAWHGFTPTDLVFPSFLFAVGAAMAFTLPRYEAAGPGHFWRKVLVRSTLVFLFGYLMYWFPFVRHDAALGWVLKPIGETRILGVLQRIALCYLAAAALLYVGSRRVVFWVTVALLLGYWAALEGFGEAGNPLSLTGNAVLRLDRWLLGESHLYRGEGIPFDPEGLLSTVPAIGNVVAGYLGMSFVRLRGHGYEVIAKLLLAAAALVALSLAWDAIFPINKKLWTSSFVLLTSGIDLAVVSALLWLIDLEGYQDWTPFFQKFGTNPLAVYLFSELVLVTLLVIPVAGGNVHDWITARIFGAVLRPVNASLAFAVAFTLFCWGLAWWLDRKRIVFKV